MSDAAETRFARHTAGDRLPPVRVDVERSRLRFFAEVIGAADPVHRDIDCARAAGFPDLVAPPTFSYVLDLLADRIRASEGGVSVFQHINCGRSFLHGEEQIESRAQIVAGETVSIETEILGFEDRKNGLLELALLRTSISHDSRGELAILTRTLIHRLAR